MNLVDEKMNILVSVERSLFIGVSWALRTIPLPQKSIWSIYLGILINNLKAHLRNKTELKYFSGPIWCVKCTVCMCTCMYMYYLGITYIYVCMCVCVMYVMCVMYVCMCMCKWD